MPSTKLQKYFLHIISHPYLKKILVLEWLLHLPSSWKGKREQNFISSKVMLGLSKTTLGDVTQPHCFYGHHHILSKWVSPE